MLTIKVVTNTNLLREWCEQIPVILTDLRDAGSVRCRRLLSVGELQGTSSVTDLRAFVESARAAVADLPGTTVNPVLAEMAAGVEQMAATGVDVCPKTAGAVQDAWNAGLHRLHTGNAALRAIVEAAAPLYGKIVAAGKIIGLMMASAVTGTLLILEKDGTPIGAAVYDDGGEDVIRDGIVAAPAYMVQGGRGVAAALGEYMAREAKRRGGAVRLVALNSRVRALYAAQGFVAVADNNMVLAGDALDKFLAKNTQFASK